MVTFMSPLNAQTAVGAELVRAQILVDKKGNPKKIELEFAIKAGFVVKEVQIFYRTEPTANYEKKKLKRIPNLHYAGTIPMAEGVEYYVAIRPERGASITRDPQWLESSQLERVEMKKRRWFFRAVYVVAIILSIALPEVLKND